MTKIVRITGIESAGRPAKKLFTLSKYSPSELTEGHMDLLIARDRMVAARDIAREIQGIGSVVAEKYNNSVDVLTDALEVLDKQPNNAQAHMEAIENDILSGVYSNHDAMAGIGNIDEIGRQRSAAAQKRKEKRQEKIKAVTNKVKTKTGAFIKKAAEKAKGGLKALTKVATAPARLLAKGILEIALPKAAPFFLYLFVNDPAVIAKLPAKVKKKRNVAEGIMRFIVDSLGMKQAHFMGIVRNGIMKQMKASPETVLLRKLQGIAGIGLVEELIPIVIAIITKLSEMFKKKHEAPTPADAPSENDFDDITPADKQALGAAIKKQSDAPEPTEQNDDEARKAGAAETDANGEIKQDFATGGRKEWNSLGK